MAKRKVEERKRKKRYKNMMQRRRQRNRRDTKQNNQNNNRTRHFFNSKDEIQRRKRRREAKRLRKLLQWKYVILDGEEYSNLWDKDFRNNQNYITSTRNKYRLYYCSKEEIFQWFNHGKILLKKIDKSFLEKVFIKTSRYYFLEKTLKRNEIYLCSKYLYLKRKK